MRGRTRTHRPTAGSLVRIAVLAILVVFAFSGSVVAHTGDDGVHHHDGWMGTHGGTGGGMFGGFGFLWMLLWTLVLIGIPVGLVYLLFIRHESVDRTTDDALDLLRRRYARGEIDEEEFDARRARLLSDRE
jgi:putative membrane protein